MYQSVLNFFDLPTSAIVVTDVFEELSTGLPEGQDPEAREAEAEI